MYNIDILPFCSSVMLPLCPLVLPGLRGLRGVSLVSVRGLRGVPIVLRGLRGVPFVFRRQGCLGAVSPLFVRLNNRLPLCTVSSEASVIALFKRVQAIFSCCKKWEPSRASAKQERRCTLELAVPILFPKSIYRSTFSIPFSIPFQYLFFNSRPFFYSAVPILFSKSICRYFFKTLFQDFVSRPCFKKKPQESTIRTPVETAAESTVSSSSCTVESYVSRVLSKKKKTADILKMEYLNEICYVVQL